MADFARWGCAIAIGLGYSQDAFLQAYKANISTQNAEVLDNHPIAEALMAFMGDKDEWEGQPAELLAKLESVAEDKKINVKSKVWPKAANALNRRINEVKPNLQDMGIFIERGHSGQRSFTIRKGPDNTVQTVQTVQTVHEHEKQELTSGRYADDMDDTVQNIVQSQIPEKQQDIDNLDDMDGLDDTFRASSKND